MFHYIAEYPGRADLSKHTVSICIRICCISWHKQTKTLQYLITNQSTSIPRHGEFEAKSPQPFGGKVISNKSDYIVNLECGGYFASNIMQD